MKKVLLDVVEPKINYDIEKLLKKRCLLKNDKIALYQHYKAIKDSTIFYNCEIRKQIEEKLKND